MSSDKWWSKTHDEFFLLTRICFLAGTTAVHDNLKRKHGDLINVSSQEKAASPSLEDASGKHSEAMFDEPVLRKSNKLESASCEPKWSSNIAADLAKATSMKIPEENLESKTVNTNVAGDTAANDHTDEPPPKKLKHSEAENDFQENIKIAGEDEVGIKPTSRDKPTETTDVANCEKGTDKRGPPSDESSGSQGETVGSCADSKTLLGKGTDLDAVSVHSVSSEDVAIDWQESDGATVAIDCESMNCEDEKLTHTNSGASGQMLGSTETKQESQDAYVPDVSKDKSNNQEAAYQTGVKTVCGNNQTLESPPDRTAFATQERQSVLPTDQLGGSEIQGTQGESTGFTNYKDSNLDFQAVLSDIEMICELEGREPNGEIASETLGRDSKFSSVEASEETEVKIGEKRVCSAADASSVSMSKVSETVDKKTNARDIVPPSEDDSDKCGRVRTDADQTMLDETVTTGDDGVGASKADEEPLRENTAESESINRTSNKQQEVLCSKSC